MTSTKLWPRLCGPKRLIEALCINLKKAKPDAAIIEMLREIKAKGFKPDYINSKVKSELGDAAAGRVRSLLKNV